MEQPNQFTVKLKLKTHKIATTDLADGSLQIGGTQQVTGQLIAKVIVPVLVAIIFHSAYLA